MQIHFFAAARAASGTAEAAIALAELPEPTLRALITELGERFTGRTASGMTLTDVMQQCSFLIDGTRSEPHAALTDQARIDVLPPFAGG